MNREQLEEGAASVETALLAPVLVLVLGLVIAVGSIALADQAVSRAAHSAARSASLATSPTDASSRIQSRLVDDLSQGGRSCSNLSVDVDPSGFHTQPGETSIVSATVTCTVPYADIIHVPGLPGTHTVTVRTTSPLDTYRER